MAKQWELFSSHFKPIITINQRSLSLWNALFNFITLLHIFFYCLVFQSMLISIDLYVLVKPTKYFKHFRYCRDESLSLCVLNGLKGGVWNSGFKGQPFPRNCILLPQSERAIFKAQSSSRKSINPIWYTSKIDALKNVMECTRLVFHKESITCDVSINSKSS